VLAGALELVDFAGTFVSPETTSFPIFSNFPIINT